MGYVWLRTQDDELVNASHISHLNVSTEAIYVSTGSVGYIIADYPDDTSAWKALRNLLLTIAINDRTGRASIISAVDLHWETLELGS